MYLPNTIYISYTVSSEAHTAALIHESLHAWFDYKRMTLKTPIVEGLCYVAQCYMDQAGNQRQQVRGRIRRRHGCNFRECLGDSQRTRWRRTGATERHRKTRT